MPSFGYHLLCLKEFHVIVNKYNVQKIKLNFKPFHFWRKQKKGFSNFHFMTHDNKQSPRIEWNKCSRLSIVPSTLSLGNFSNKKRRKRSNFKIFGGVFAFFCCSLWIFLQLQSATTKILHSVRSFRKNMITSAIICCKFGLRICLHYFSNLSKVKTYCRQLP